MIYELKKDKEVKLPWKYQIVLSWAIAKLLVDKKNRYKKPDSIVAAARW